MIKSFYATDDGDRALNEDSVCILSNKSGEHMMLVADGLGGYNKGEVASSIVLTHMGREFTRLVSVGTRDEAVNWISENVKIAHAKIREYATNHKDAESMATTIVIAILTKDFLLVGNVGDSMAYVLKNEKLYPVTKPHNFVRYLVESGEISEEEAKAHPKKHCVTRALGNIGDSGEIDLKDVEIGDAILLCSDGLTDMLSDDQIERVLNDDKLSVEGKVGKLIKKCKARGTETNKNDNISIACLFIEGDESK